MKTSSLPPKSATETRTAFAAACALYFPCMALAVWGASLAPTPAVPVAGDIMLAVAHFQSEAAAAPAPASAAEPAPAAEPVAEPVAEPEPAPEPEPEPAPEPEPQPEPQPEPLPEPMPDPEPAFPAPVPEMKPEPKPEPVEVVKPVKKVTEARRPPEKRRVDKERRPDRPERSHRDKPAPEEAQGAAAPQTAPVASAPEAAEPELLVAGRDGDPFLAQVREAVLSTLEYPRQARRMRREGTVTVQFVISPEGRAAGIRIHEGSGHEMLDREACAAVARAASLWGAPGRTVRIRMPVVFTLKRGGAS